MYPDRPVGLPFRGEVLDQVAAGRRAAAPFGALGRHGPVHQVAAGRRAAAPFGALGRHGPVRFDDGGSIFEVIWYKQVLKIVLEIMEMGLELSLIHI